MTKDRVTGLMALVLGISVAVGAYRLPPSKMAGDIGPAVFPYIAAILLTVCGAGLLITGKKKEEESYFDKKQLIRLCSIFVVVALYCVVLYYFGFLISTLIVGFVLCMMFGREDHIGWGKCLFFSVVLTIVLYLIFAKLFSFRLPTGQLL